MLKFDLKNPPPTVEQIETEKKRMTVILYSGLSCTFAFFTFIGASGISFMIYNTRGIAAPSFATPLILVSCVVILSIIIASCMVPIVRRLFIVNKRISALAPLSDAKDDKHLKIIGYCRRDELCEAYRLAVALQDRIMTCWEAEMIEQWVENSGSRQDPEERHRQNEEAYYQLQSKEPIGSTKS
jgi:hypothetical protein